MVVTLRRSPGSHSRGRWAAFVPCGGFVGPDPARDRDPDPDRGPDRPPPPDGPVAPVPDRDRSPAPDRGPDRRPPPDGPVDAIPPDQLAAARFLLAMSEQDNAEMWRVLMSTPTLPLLAGVSLIALAFGSGLYGTDR